MFYFRIICSRIPRSESLLDWQEDFRGRTSLSRAKQRAKSLSRRFAHVKVFLERKVVAEFLNPTVAEKPRPQTQQRAGGRTDNREATASRTGSSIGSPWNLPPRSDPSPSSPSPSGTDRPKSPQTLIERHPVLPQRPEPVQTDSGARRQVYNDAARQQNGSGARKRSCACAGSNDNCCHCLGSGFVTVGQTNTIITDAQVGSTVRLPLAMNPAVPHGVRSALRPPKQPFKKRHRASRRIQARRGSPARPKTTCPRCGCVLRVSILSRHLRSVHRDQTAKPVTKHWHGAVRLWGR